MIRRSSYTVILTGAGVSTESGLPDFRSSQGLWKGIDPRRVASTWALQNTPLEFFEFYRMRIKMMETAVPNRAHLGIAKLERRGLIKAIVTQNVDSLHLKAGSVRVIEVHGNLREAVCNDCRRLHPIDLLTSEIDSVERVPRCSCGGLIRPNVVLFGESLPFDEFQAAIDEVERCDLLVVFGSSLEVAPVNSLPRMVASGGRALAIVNLDVTPLDSIASLVVRDRCSNVIDGILDLLG